MRTKVNGAGRLREAKRQFDCWRRGCRRPGRVPRRLWVLAAEAAAEHGIQETAEQLRVRSRQLEQWIKNLDIARVPAGLDETQFVELPPLAIGSPGECQVEVEAPSGRKLRVVLQGQAVARLAAVLEAVWKEESP